MFWLQIGSQTHSALAKLHPTEIEIESEKGEKESSLQHIAMGFNLVIEYRIDARFSTCHHICTIRRFDMFTLFPVTR